MKQRVFILRDGVAVAPNTTYEDQLNAMLDDGWVISQMCPMPSSISSGKNTQYSVKIPPTCAVYLTKQNETT